MNALDILGAKSRLTKRYMIAAVAASAALAGGMAAINHALPAQHIPSHTVVVQGDYGRGTPLPSEVQQCQASYSAEMIYTPRTDTWLCAAP